MTNTKFLLVNLAVLLCGLTYQSLFAQTVNMEVQQGPNIDVVLTVGITGQNIDTFEEDLGAALESKGIPADKLYVQGFERTTISSNSEDAADIFNNWIRWGYNPETWEFVDADKVIRRINNDYLAGFYDPVFDSSNYTLEADMTTSGGDNDDMGITFGMSNGPVGSYLFNLSGAVRTLSNSEFMPGHGFASGLYEITRDDGNANPRHYLQGLQGAESTIFDPTSNTTWYHVKLEVSGKNVKIWIDDVQVIDYTATEDIGGSYGFFSNSQPYATFKNIEVTSLTLKKFKDVLREPQWRNSAMRFNVNLDDQEVDDFNNDDDLAEILMRTINEDIHYIGWGLDDNKTQFERFVEQNNDKGTFVNRDTGSWSSWMDDMAQYIYEQYLFETVTAGDYFIAGTSVEIAVDPTEMKTNTANASYPSGRWKITHDETFFPNNEGRVSWNDLYLEDVPEFYEKPGKYSFTFEDLPTSPTTLFFHRKPIASFTYSSATGVFNDTSYDLDGGANNGIAQTEWKWKSVDAAMANDWTIGVFDKNSVPDGEYLVMLSVQDHQGVWSSPTSAYILVDSSSSSGSEDLPVAQFNIQPDELFTYSGSMTIGIENNSIDPYGRNLSTEEWIVTQRVYDEEGNPTDTEIHNTTTEMTDFSAYNNLSAEYIISLRVQTDTGVWSEPFYRTLTITHDTTNPTLEANPENGTMDTGVDILLTFQDENAGSGFDVQRYVLLQDSNPPASDASSWSSWSNSQSKNVSFQSGGNGWYIHAEAKDNAGNTGTASFGPYDITLVVGADDDLAVLDEDSVSDPIDVLYNDVYDTGNTPTVTITVQGSKGTATVNGSNQVIYTPNPNENGSDSVTYELDDAGTKVTAKITLSIVPVDDLPVFTAPTAAYNVSSAVYSGNSTNVSSQLSSPYGITFNNDGTKMFVSGIFSSEIAEYTLSTPYDVSTANYVDSLTGMSGRTTGINFNNDGTKIYYASANSGNNITEYSLSTPYDISTATFSQAYSASEGPSYDDVTFNGTGSKMYLLAYSTDYIYEYTLSTPFDISTAVYTNNSYEITEDGSPMELDFNGDGSRLYVITIGGELLAYDLSVPYDLSSISYSGLAFDTDDQEGNPYGLAFNSNGSKFYTVGFTKRVHEYHLLPILEFEENGTGPVANADANDGDGGANDVGINYALAVGGDNDLFAIDGSTGELTFLTPPDFEDPDDADGDNEYQITIRATDTGATINQAVTVKVTDVDDAPPAGYTVSIDQSDIDATNEDAISFTFANAEIGATFNYTFSSDGGGTNVTGTGTIVTATDQIAGIDLSGLGDGTITLSVTLTDTNSNEGDPATDTKTKETDVDNDGIKDTDDNCLNTANADQLDTNNDGEGDACDDDDDGDGTLDGDDAFPLDPTEDTDSDGDGTGDNADTDDDNDGTEDGDDAFPFDPTEDTDTDGDGTGDNADTDDDNDGTLDGDDAFPLDPTEDTDSDGDGTGDNADTDDDNDGTLDGDDAFPLDPTEDTDSDGDGTGDNADTDDDNDGTEDGDDAFPFDPTEDTDTDGDGTGDNADTDDDNDGTLDGDDAFPFDPTEDTDTDGDGTGDNADTDDDNDGVPDTEDDQPLDGTDTDGDGIPDSMDPDDDNDGTDDIDDVFPLDPDEDTDTDWDGIGNNADNDDDDDGTPDVSDAFPLDPTEDSDADNDGIGDNSDDDDDNDGVPDGDDDFPNNSEPLITPAQAFTPNGDGMNEAWVIPGIDNYPNNTVKVFNRWGHVVFATKSYKNNWEGFYKDHREKLPSGSYMYVIDLGDGSAPVQGWIYINY